VLVKIKLLLKDKRHGEYNVKLFEVAHSTLNVMKGWADLV
jgi:hypothetical protein